MKKNDNCLILFGKYPEPGKVKQRLAIATSDQFAASLAGLLGEHLFARLSSGSNYDLWFHHPAGALQQTENWTKKRMMYATQMGSNIGERMGYAFGLMFEKGYKKIVLVGTDIPDVSEAHITEAFWQLDYSDVVLGPAKDGGYYLVGMTEECPWLFSSITFSRSDVLRRTIQRAHDFHKDVVLLDELTDIDELTDLKHWLSSNANGTLAASIRQLLRVCEVQL